MTTIQPTAGITPSTQPTAKLGAHYQIPYTLIDQIGKGADSVTDWFDKRLVAHELAPKAEGLAGLWQGLKYRSLKTGHMLTVQLTQHDYVKFEGFQLSDLTDMRIFEKAPFKWIENYKKIPALGPLLEKLPFFSRPIKIAGAPIGAVLILYYVGLTVPRALQGYRRGKLDDETIAKKLPKLDASAGFFKRLYYGIKKALISHDLREVWDVIYRDVYSITAFIYFLKGFSNYFAKQTQKAEGIRIFNAVKDDVIDFAEQDVNARIHNPKVLAAHWRFNQGGLLQALKKKYLAVTSLPTQIKQTAGQTLEEIAQEAQAFMGKMEGAVGKTGTDLTQHLEDAYQHLAKMDTLRDGVLSKFAHNPELKEHLATRWPEYRSFLARFAKNKRSPWDFLSFALVFLTMGMLPVWFNQWRNTRNFEKEMIKEALRARTSKPKPVTEPVLPTVVPAPTAFPAFVTSAALPQVNPFSNWSSGTDFFGNVAMAQTQQGPLQQFQNGPLQQYQYGPLQQGAYWPR